MFSFDFDDLGPEEAPPQSNNAEVAQRPSAPAPQLSSRTNAGYARDRDAPPVLGASQRERAAAAALARPPEAHTGVQESGEPVVHRRHFVSPNAVHVSAEPGRPQGQLARVASMLMLLPSMLGEIPGALHTYLWYHLLAPQGPQLWHVFIFVDKPLGAKEDALATESGSLLERWLRESNEAAQLRQRVTLLDGSAAAALAAADERSQRRGGRPAARPAQREAELRGCAAMGELCAKQVLNMERCVDRAHELGIDWLICNLDVDEALVLGGRSADCFGSLPVSLLELQLLNHEAIPEAAGGAADYFTGCTLFKRNPNLLGDKKEGYMRFWSERALAAGVKLAYQELGDMQWKRGSGSTELYFTAYSHGKAAVRVAPCHAQGTVPLGPHRWNVPEKAAARAKTADASILHYNNCEGAKGLARRYSGRKGESWNQLRMHTLCQHLYGKNPECLGDLFADGLLVTERDEQEVQAQIKAGVCLRIRTVQKACQAFKG